MKTHALRLDPGVDLKNKLLEFCKTHKIQAGFVLSGIGSLKNLSLRLANSKDLLQKNEKFEILSLQGSLTESAVHLHMSVADSSGNCWGGHLMEGCEIFTTAEILVGELPDVVFAREMDPRSGYPELVIKKR